MMNAIKIFAYGKSKPGHETELRAVLQELVSATRKEQAMFEGLNVYEAYETESPGEFIFHEEYTTQEAFDRHMNTPHVQAALPHVMEHLEGEYMVWKVASINAAK